MHLYAQTHLCIVVSWWKSIRKVTMKSKYAKMQCPFLTWLSIAHELCISLFVGPKMSIKWLVLHIVDVQISIFHWTLQGFTRLVSCVWILCATFPYFHINLWKMLFCCLPYNWDESTFIFAAKIAQPTYNPRRCAHF